MINIPLLRKTVEWVEEQDTLSPRTNPERVWNQRTWYESIALGDIFGLGWSCGTAMCFAGKVAIEAGWEPVGQSHVKRGEVLMHIDDAARLELGISENDSEYLFEGDNTAEDIRRIAENIAGERL